MQISNVPSNEVRPGGGLRTTPQIRVRFNYKTHNFALALLLLLPFPSLQVFKICVDYWHTLAQDLYDSGTASSIPTPALNLGGGLRIEQRKQHYEQVLSGARHVMISRMAKPEEVRRGDGTCGSYIDKGRKLTYSDLSVVASLPLSLCSPPLP